MPVTETPAADVLTCTACAAPVPLAKGDATRCGFCGADVAIPPAHQALHAEREVLRQARVRAEAEWRKLPRPLPSWVEHQGHWVIILGLLVVCVANGIGAKRWGWWDDPQTALTFALVTPLAVLLFAFIDALAGQMYADSARDLVAPRGFRGLTVCRACGAPLGVEPGALSATCDYCGADSVIIRRGALSRREYDAAHEAAGESLAEAVRSLQSWHEERRLVRIIVASVLGPIWAGFVIAWWF